MPRVVTICSSKKAEFYYKYNYQYYKLTNF